MSLYLKDTFENNSKILGIWHITEPEEMLREQMRALNYQPSRADQHRLVNLRHEKRRLEWYAVRLLLHDLLESPFKINYTENGKPFLEFVDFHISISHSANFVAVLLSRKGRTGLDIEQISKRVRKVQRKFMSEDEQADVDPEDSKMLTIYWAAKEALYKLHGNSDITLKQHIHIQPFLQQALGVFQGKIIKGYMAEYHSVHYFLFPGYVIVWTA